MRKDFFKPFAKKSFEKLLVPNVLKKIRVFVYVIIT